MRLATTAAFVAGAVLAVGTALPAQAAAPPKIDLRGASVGSYTLDGTGAAHLTGDAIGKPFDGTYTAVLTADDGTLPEPGVCEPATATVDITGDRGRYLQLAGSGNVCGQWADATYVVTHRFTGRYVVSGSSVRNTLRTDGWLGLTLATEDRANLEAIDT